MDGPWKRYVKIEIQPGQIKKYFTFSLMPRIKIKKKNLTLLEKRSDLEFIITRRGAGLEN